MSVSKSKKCFMIKLNIEEVRSRGKKRNNWFLFSLLKI